LQEREIARILLEYGTKKIHDQFVAEYVLNELPGEDVMENAAVIKMIHEFRNLMQQHLPFDKNHFIYHPDNTLSTLAVSLLDFPYEESMHWKRELSQSTGYQQSLFKQDYKSFINTVRPENEEQLLNFLKIGKDNTSEQVESAVNYLKLRKIKKLLLQNHADLEKATDPQQQETLTRTHLLLKQMEIELTQKLGTVVIR
jgi:DNA primase